tara:strand:- start:51 stop:356 length:306 start_codon:yes stop_codon:yes gene_type:complete
MGNRIGDIQATAFQDQVWSRIRLIPAGETVTYRDIAEYIGKPSSSRAVANACAANPEPISTPCHRVIRSDGQIGGYSGPGGTSGKEVLLAVERRIKNSRNI